MTSRVVAALAAVVAFSSPASAAPMYDFSSLSGGTVTNLGPDELLPGGITGSAFYLNGTWQPSVLIVRNEGPDDQGLGVCSEPTGCYPTSGTGGGDWNELSQLSYHEAILLTRPDNTFWTGLWLSSLDDNDGSSSQGLENGVLYWGNTSDVGALIALGNSLSFSYPAFGGSLVEGQLVLGGFDPFAKYVLFMPGGIVGDNNDYLVWGASLGSPQGDLPPVPEPASLLLLGSGLVALRHGRRTTRQR